MRPCVVIPIFDEAPTIGCIAAVASRHAPVLVVDDGSTDAGAAIARAAGAEVLRHPRRLGKGQALRTGFAAARRRGASHVVTLDGDGQHSPDDVPRLLASARESPGSVIIGARGTGGTADAARVNAIRVAGFFVNWASGLRVADTQSGFRVYPVALLDRLALRRGGFVFETEVLMAAAAHGVGVVEIPIGDVPRAARRSRFRPVMDGIAIGAYLSRPVLRRWAIETGAGVAEVAALFDRGRLRARHAEMLQAAAAFGDSPPAWGAALSAVAVGRARTRLRGWWDHPRRRRATVAATATLVAPVLLALASARALGGRLVPDAVTPIVQRFYDQTRLEPEPGGGVTPIAERAGEGTTVAAGHLP